MLKKTVCFLVIQLSTIFYTYYMYYYCEVLHEEITCILWPCSCALVVS